MSYSNVGVMAWPDVFGGTRLKGLDLTQKISVGVFLLLLVSLPLAVVLALNPVNYRSRAYFPTTPPVTPTPVITESRVFVTSTTYNGNLGGLTGADAKCQERANAANLGGIWKAWLSDSSTSVSSRFIHYNGKYILLDGTIIAYSWDDLTVNFDNFNNPLEHVINMYENGQTRVSGEYHAWTNTTILGQSGSKDCVGWTNNSYPNFGGYGSSASIGNAWTEAWDVNGFCSDNFRLYCFEQVTEPTSTPTPTPIPPTPPVIVTTALPAGTRFSPYAASIIGTDLNAGETLTMTASGLPQDLKFGNCQQQNISDRPRITCQITGRPTKAGSYTITVSLKDSTGLSSQKSLNLKINQLIVQPIPTRVLPSQPVPLPTQNPF